MFGKSKGAAVSSQYEQRNKGTHTDIFWVMNMRDVKNENVHVPSLMKEWRKTTR